MHKGKEKKLKLLDKMIKLTDVVTLFKTKLEKFAMQRSLWFSIQNTAKTFASLAINLYKPSILKIHDFSENYSCLSLEKIQSSYRIQETATLYPIVVIQKLG